MQNTLELRWHGRGGQGAKTAALLLADVAFKTGQYVQGFPEYGPERMGAPITAYNRISDHENTVHSNIYDPDYNDMLRVSFMHQFGRGKLGDLVSLLSGRDFIERTFKEEIAQESFEKLTAGVINFMNKYTFEQFVLAIKSAGFMPANVVCAVSMHKETYAGSVCSIK